MVRDALVRFALRRAARAGAAPRADFWLRLACAWSPAFGPPFAALIELRRAREDRLGAMSAAQAATRRFPASAAAWMLLGQAYEGAFRMKEALAAYEQALVLEERADAALAAGELYRRAGQAAEAAARFARAYAAGGGAEALWRNAQALFQAGDERAAEQALTLWSTLVPRGRERLAAARVELRGGAKPHAG